MSERESTQFYRRTLCLGIFQIVLVLVLIGRMYYLQIVEGNYYHLLAEGNRIASRPLLPLRGHLLDRNQVPLAENKMSFRLVFLMEKKDELEEALEKLSTLVSLSPEEKESVLKAAHKKKSLDSIIIKENLTWEEMSAIEIHSAELPGISVEVGAIRFYPEMENGAHSIGYIASPSEHEQEGNNSLKAPGSKIGKVGLEKLFDERLRGKLGSSSFEVNARRQIVRELSQSPSIPGEDITLTIDKRLQSFAQERLLEYESGSAVVIDIQNGDVLAMVSTPSFDPNLFPQGISYRNWGELRDNPYIAMTNKSVSGLYPPGSTIKVFVALAALEAGIINNDTLITCPGYVQVGTHRFHCHRKGGHGPLNMTQAIAKSCDVYFYEVAKRVGIDRMSALLMDLGLGEGGFIEFPHRKKGLVPTKEWKREKKGAKWTVSDSIQVSIGQGFMLSTPLELAVATARLTSGKRVVPRLERGHAPHFDLLGYDPHNLKILLEAMDQTVNVPGGTAYRWRIPQEGLEMAGKTGTSQVRRITMKQRKAGQTRTTHLPWKYREHGLYIGVAPAHSPRYAIAVVIEHVGSSAPADQVARDVLLKAQLLERESSQ